MSTCAHLLCRLSTGGRVCQPGWGWGDQSLWAAWLLSLWALGRSPRRGMPSGSLGEPGWVGCPRVASEYQVLSSSFPCAQSLGYGWPNKPRSSFLPFPGKTWPDRPWPPWASGHRACASPTALSSDPSTCRALRGPGPGEFLLCRVGSGRMCPGCCSEGLVCPAAGAARPSLSSGSGLAHPPSQWEPLSQGEGA